MHPSKHAGNPRSNGDRNTNHKVQKKGFLEIAHSCRVGKSKLSREAEQSSRGDGRGGEEERRREKRRGGDRERKKRKEKRKEKGREGRGGVGAERSHRKKSYNFLFHHPLARGFGQMV